MSLVGTRPPTVDEWEQYELHHRSRMRGLFEWDDMIHNGLGCMVGCLGVDGVVKNRG